MIPQILRGLGASPTVTAADGLPGIICAVAAGSVLAVAVAVGLSPLTLFGPVRVAAPSAGIYLDTAVLGLGALSLFAVLGAVAVVIGYRLAPHRVAARGQPAGAGRARSGPRWPPECRRQWWRVLGSPWSLGTAGPRCRCDR